MQYKDHTRSQQTIHKAWCRHSCFLVLKYRRPWDHLLSANKWLRSQHHAVQTDPPQGHQTSSTQPHFSFMGYRTDC
ncbi:hypothetical protein I79_017648 [Cricetulus griseus]|uniref:Uncharacterized protein n=1 Tax=Cricetulus griseus TaxID=10029 RepID=G3I2L0_CRIGR|nr:hypothetical protein I79_017648 [Cricetulus griseus]